MRNRRATRGKGTPARLTDLDREVIESGIAVGVKFHHEPGENEKYRLMVEYAEQVYGGPFPPLTADEAERKRRDDRLWEKHNGRALRAWDAATTGDRAAMRAAVVARYRDSTVTDALARDLHGLSAWLDADEARRAKAARREAAAAAARDAEREAADAASRAAWAAEIAAASEPVELVATRLPQREIEPPRPRLNKYGLGADGKVYDLPGDD